MFRTILLLSVVASSAWADSRLTFPFGLDLRTSKATACSSGDICFTREGVSAHYAVRVVSNPEFAHTAPLVIEVEYRVIASDGTEMTVTLHDVTETGARVDINLPLVRVARSK